MEVKSTNSKTGNPDRAHLLAWFWRLGLISEQAYHELVPLVSRPIMPSNTNQSLHLVDDVVTQVEKKVGGKFNTEPWLAHLTAVDSRLSDLEKGIGKVINEAIAVATKDLKDQIASLEKELDQVKDQKKSSLKK